MATKLISHVITIFLPDRTIKKFTTNPEIKEHEDYIYIESYDFSGDMLVLVYPDNKRSRFHKIPFMETWIERK
jgi:hypothetical protein